MPRPRHSLQGPGAENVALDLGVLPEPDCNDGSTSKSLLMRVSLFQLHSLQLGAL